MSSEGTTTAPADTPLAPPQGDTQQSSATTNVVPTTVEADAIAGGTENDSSYGDEVSQYSASVNSSVYNYVTRYGRTYHAYKEGKWCLPNDEQELDRLDVHHHLILTAMFEKLYMAPLPADFSGRVLDFATGTGIWCIDFADKHPGSHVIGNDLSPVQPGWVPPNVHFYIEDIEDDWTYGDDEKFDFIHGRFLAGAVQNWPKLMAQTYKHTKPGCWVEFQDWNTWLYSQDNTLPEESALNKFHQLACYSRHSQGYNQKPGPYLEEWLKEAGFVDVQVQKILLPLGPWPKDEHLKRVGAINHVQMMKAFEALCYGMLTTLPQDAGGPWTYEEIQVFLVEIRKDMSNRKIHSLYDFYVAWGRKPER